LLLGSFNAAALPGLTPGHVLTAPLRHFLPYMIPHIIHYCWFGKGPKPAEALRYIEGWRALAPGFRLVEWNEENFDVFGTPYTANAYRARKFAFVSDYARGKALLEMGGVYLDTDVELVSSLEPFLERRAFFGFESGNVVATSTIGAEPGHPYLAEYMDQYKGRTFLLPDGRHDLTTNVTVLTRILSGRGMVADGSFQNLPEGAVIFPMNYFSPLDYVAHSNHREFGSVKKGIGQGRISPTRPRGLQIDQKRPAVS
jgi:hypothetical protein